MRDLVGHHSGSGIQSLMCCQLFINSLHCLRINMTMCCDSLVAGAVQSMAAPRYSGFQEGAMHNRAHRILDIDYKVD